MDPYDFCGELKSRFYVLASGVMKEIAPFSGKGWTLYSGEAIVNDLAKGMRRADASLAVSDVMGDFHAAVSPRMAFAGASSTTTTYTFGDVHLNAADAQGITAIEQLVRLIETA